MVEVEIHVAILQHGFPEKIDQVTVSHRFLVVDRHPDALMLGWESGIHSPTGDRGGLHITAKRGQDWSDVCLNQEIEAEERERVVRSMPVKSPHRDCLPAVIEVEQIFESVHERVAATEQCSPGCQAPAIEVPCPSVLRVQQPTQQSWT